MAWTVILDAGPEIGSVAKRFPGHVQRRPAFQMDLETGVVARICGQWRIGRFRKEKQSVERQFGHRRFRRFRSIKDAVLRAGLAEPRVESRRVAERREQ